jgi:hypothetical protein
MPDEPNNNDMEFSDSAGEEESVVFEIPKGKSSRCSRRSGSKTSSQHVLF